MTFLARFDHLLADDAEGRSDLFAEALRTDWLGLFAELRRERPVLELPSMLVVSRWVDVVDVLSRPETFRVPYREHMDPSVGPFMLARDGEELNWRDKSVMQALMRWEDLPGLRAMAERAVDEALARAEPGQLDVVTTLSRHVPLRVVQSGFGLKGPDERLLSWSRATQADMFHNARNDAATTEACVLAGREMRDWLVEFLAGREPWSCAQGEDTVSRLLRLHASGLSGMEVGNVVSNVCGLLVGAIETTSHAIVNALEQILLRPDVTERAIQAAGAPDVEPLEAIVREALRFNPMAKFVVRIASEPAVIASGGVHRTRVEPGRAVGLFIGSAMFDEAVLTDPDSFLDRPSHAYIHTGVGPHACLGRHVAQAIIPAAVRKVLLLPSVRLLPGAASVVDFENGPFPEHFRIAWGEEGPDGR